MDKLGEFATYTEKFLRSLVHDLGLPAKKGEWLASNFGNQSVAFDSEFANAIPDAAVHRGNEALELIAAGDDPLIACEKGLIGYTTAAEFSQIGKALDPDEKFYMGVYRNGSAPEWHGIPYSRTEELRQLLATPTESYGSVQGVVHSWHSGAQPPFFQIRELASGDLVHCDYKSDLHARILRAHEQRNSIVHVFGRIRWDRTKNHILDIDANDLQITQPLSEFEFERLFGSMPEFTGEMSTSEYIDWIRGGGD